MKRTVANFLQDILDAINDLESFTKDIDLNAFQNNKEKILAIVKLLEILGEAVQQIPEDLRKQYSHIPWGSIAGMRNTLVHQYWGIDVEVVWTTVQEDIPPLKLVIQQILKEISSSN